LLSAEQIADFQRQGFLVVEDVLTSEQVKALGAQADRIASLESEVGTLRVALIEAEEALAMASAGEGGLSTEWVMMTISRYSGELEEAQVHIQQLEAELRQNKTTVSNDLIISLAQELRTPMTSIAGYTDLLLKEAVGLLVPKQRDFLQKVEANVERMNALLEQIVQAATVSEPAVPSFGGSTDIRETVEAAVNAVMTQVREKDLRFNLHLSPSLPPMGVGYDALYQITLHLLQNACHASKSDSQIGLKVQADLIDNAGNAEEELLGFLQLAVNDSGGGIAPKDRLHVFETRLDADTPLIPGLGDTGVGLSMTQTLVTANGGRIWVDSNAGIGSTFTVLLPIMANGSSGQTGALNPEALNGSAQ